MEQIKIEGLRIGYEHLGRGQLLMLLHGFFGDNRVWRPQFEGLSHEYEVIAWDTPGCGQSSNPPERFGMPRYARCLRGVIAAL